MLSQCGSHKVTFGPEKLSTRDAHMTDIRIWPILRQIDTKWLNNLDHSSKWHLLLTEYASLTWAAPNLSHFLFYSLLSFIIPFATLSRSGYVSFAASMCLKFTSASFRGKLLKSKPCFHVIKLARHSQRIPWPWESASVADVEHCLFGHDQVVKETHSFSTEINTA